MEKVDHFPQGAPTSKKLRLFGFDFDFHGNDASNNSSYSDCNVEQTQGKRKCPFCDKEFTNSQALGGHQNAHKKERLMMRKSELAEKKASIEVYLRSLDHQFSRNSNSLLYDSPTFYPFTSDPMNEPQLLFNSTPYRDGYDGPNLYALQVYVPY